MKRAIYLAALSTSIALGTALMETSAFADAASSPYAATDTPAPRQIRLLDAVRIAERQVGGQATRARTEREDGQTLFEIEIRRDADTIDVTVDGRDGRVIEAKADQADGFDWFGLAESDDEENDD